MKFYINYRRAPEESGWGIFMHQNGVLFGPFENYRIYWLGFFYDSIWVSHLRPFKDNETFYRI